MLIDAKRNRLYLGAIRSSRTDAVAGSLITYDLALEASPQGRIAEAEVRSLVQAWWAERLEPGVWPLGRALDAHLDLGATTGDLVLAGLRLRTNDDPTTEAEYEVDGTLAWVGSAYAGVPLLISRSITGSGASVAYFRMMNADLASETYLDSGAVLIVEGGNEVHRKKDRAPLPVARPAVAQRKPPVGPLVYVLIALALIAAALLALL